MNKTVTSLVSIALSLLIGFILYNNMVAHKESRLRNIKSRSGEEARLTEKHKELQKELNEIKELNNKLNLNPKIKSLYVRNLLLKGNEESNIINLLLASQVENTNDKQVYFKIIDFNLGTTYFFDIEDELSMQSEGNESDLEQLANNNGFSKTNTKEFSFENIDENGNLKGMEVDDGTWKGVEILPIKLRFEGTYKGFMKFMEALEPLPYHFIRSLDTIFVNNSDNDIKGTLILSFPLRDK